MSVLMDSYTTSNVSDNSLDSSNPGIGQSFTVSQKCKLDRVKFYLSKVGSPTGSAYAKIYAITGTYGSTSKPTGSALATSYPLDVTALGAYPTSALWTLPFFDPDKIVLNAGSKYFVSLEFSNSTNPNLIISGYDQAGTHSGNEARIEGGVWTAKATYDTMFEVYADLYPVPDFLSSQVNIAPGETITFTDKTANTPTAWSWDFGDSTTSTLQNPTKSYAAPGTYSVTLTATNAIGADSTTKTGLITVTNKPALTGISSLTGVQSITFS